MNELPAQSDHDRIGALLPWYINGTLQTDEHEQVRRHVDVCQDCRANLELMEHVQSRLYKETTVPIVPDAPVTEFLSSLDAARVAPARRTLRWAIAASIAAFTLMSVAFMALRFGAPNQVFETATSTNTPAVVNYVLTLHFTDGTTHQDRDQIFADISAREITTSDQDNVYEILVQLDATTLEDVQSYADDIATRPEISTVEITAVQLPLRDDP